jgi:ABC-type molybdenum transport system ATPase subunit/photorepair protein PhrA
VDAYMATLADFPDKETVRKSLEDFFKTATLNVTIEKWTIVEYNGSDKASLLASLITEVDANGTKTKVRGVILNEAVKVGDKWLLNADAASLSNEQL